MLGVSRLLHGRDAVLQLVHEIRRHLLLGLEAVVFSRERNVRIDKT
jgi:hypothetical protein